MSRALSVSRLLAAGTFALTVLANASAALAQPKTVRVWHTETEPQTVRVMQDIARRFEAANPNVKVDIEGLAWADLEGKIAAALAAGTPPELSHGQPITCTALHACSCRSTRWCMPSARRTSPRRRVAYARLTESSSASSMLSARR